MNISYIQASIDYPDDVFIWNDFLNQLAIDHKLLFQELMAIPVHDNDKSIDYDPYKARRILGSHKNLCSRGHPIKRHKVWFQDNIAQGYRKYSYTGWQHKIALAQCDSTAMPMITQKLFNYCSDEYKINHGIFTVYNTGDDFIPFHSDKLHNIEQDSWIIVVKLGSKRYFDLSKNNDVVFHEEIEPGAAIFMKSHTANVELKHSVPKMNHAALSGSIVLRNIKTIIPWEDQIKRANNTVGGVK
jgi:hypothetical protein